MRVLVTRAADEAVRTREMLAAAGHDVVLSPVIEIVATRAEWPDGVVDAVLATSAQAFAILDDAFGPAPEARRLMPLYVVGERTAERARARGFVGPTAIAPSATALALRFGKLAHRPLRLVYLAGRDRKPDVETALEVTGHDTQILVVYEAAAAAALADAAVRALRTNAVDAVLHFSRRSASLFCNLADAGGVDLAGPRHLCLSDDVADPLRQRGLPYVEVAGAPNEAALLERLDQA